MGVWPPQVSLGPIRPTGGTMYMDPIGPTTVMSTTMAGTTMAITGVFTMAGTKSDVVALQDPKTGKFLPGNPGGGRTAGSKNRITLMKVALEDAFRDQTYNDVLEVLRMIVEQALDGDKASQRMIWDASVSKGISPQDKEATDKKGFTVHHMHHDVNDDKGKDDE